MTTRAGAVARPSGRAPITKLSVGWREPSLTVGLLPRATTHPLLKIPRNLRPNPFSHRHRDAIPNHSVSIIIASHESERVRNSLQSSIFSNRVRSYTPRKSFIRHQSRTQVFRVMRNTSGCDI